MCVSIYHTWGILGEDEIYDGLEYMNVFWADEYVAPSGASNNYFTDLEQKLGNDYDGKLLFLTEPDMNNQSNKTPLEGAQLYAQLKAQCPDCQLYGPMVSSQDYQCTDFGNLQEPYYDALQAKYDNWCWFQEWWEQVENLTGGPPEMAGYTVHHTLGRSVRPLAPINSLEATVASLGDNRPFKVIVSEYGIVKEGPLYNRCDSAFMGQMTRAFSRDDRVEYFFAFTPNLLGETGWCTFFEPFGTRRFTRTGWAFARNGN